MLDQHGNEKVHGLMKDKELDTIAQASLLYDFYGALLTDKQREVMELYHEENYSIVEIADELGVTKQAIHENLRKSEKILRSYEEKLGLVIGHAAQETGSRIVSSVILQNVPVIATDREYDLESSSSGYGTMTLCLPTKAAILMVQARTMGQITYLLRNVRDTKAEQDRSNVTVAPGASFGDTVRAFQN